MSGWLYLTTLILSVLILKAKNFRSYNWKIHHSSLFIMAGLSLILLINPLPHLFDAHSYSVYSLGDYLRRFKSLPLIHSNDLFAHATLWYPSVLVQGVSVSFISFLKSEYFLFVVNLLGPIALISSIGLIIEESVVNHKDHRVIWYCGIGFIIALPHIYDVFIRYPTSDTFSLYFVTLIIICSSRLIKNLEFYLISLVIGLAISLRSYFGPIILVYSFFLLYEFLKLNGKNKFILNRKRLILSLSFSGLIVFLMMAMTYNQYRTVTGNVTQLRVDPLDSESLLLKKFGRAFEVDQVKEKNALMELWSSVSATDVNYKTMAKTKTTPLSLVLLLSGYACLLLLGFVLIRRFFDLWTKELIYRLSFYWFLSTGIIWILFAIIGVNFPIVKIIFYMVPSFLIATIFSIQRAIVVSPKDSFRIKLAIGLSFFIFFVGTIDGLKGRSLNWNEHQAVQWGGFHSVSEYLKIQNVKYDEVLWIVRPERGAYLPYFMDRNRFIWESKNFYSPKYLSLHEEASVEKALGHLHQMGIKWLVTMNTQELERFVLNGFERQEGYPEGLVKELIRLGTLKEVTDKKSHIKLNLATPEALVFKIEPANY